MALKYYHAEPLANSLKSMIPLKEKGLDYESVYVDLHRFEQHSDWFVAINPEGQVPVLDHDGTIVTHTTVINEYLEDAFPDANPADGPLRPRDPAGAARMRYWNKFVDEQVMNHVSMHGWHRLIRVVTQSIEDDRFEELMSHVPLPDQRKKWRTARSGFSEADLANAKDKIVYALGKVDAQLAQTRWLAGDSYTLADINFYAHCGVMADRMFPDLQVNETYPNLVRWRDAMSARPAVQAALNSEDRTQPGLRTWSGDGRE
ncbi:glutathione S-transferase [Altererythrobacter sp. B11]|uniref:glutathione S-transferase family protein n=1 Tax=Altererythrobacter sp. B11 TaxID=2060312 RepID=UPI000DC71158|nr:glutathione S-transferase family protein [Altererythrobacter sp. B11]BBC71095.1 glutathione S-transferase [Altererythrobacter sp. B11]